VPWIIASKGPLSNPATAAQPGNWSGFGRYVTFQLAEVAVPQQMFANILSLIALLRAPPAPA
jgi:hypothetical protein